MKIKDEFNTVNIVIPRWAITRLNLSGSELIVYAVIYTHMECYRLIGSDRYLPHNIKYLSTWTGSYYKANQALVKLLNKGYVMGDVVNGYRCDFTHLDEMIVKDAL